MNENCPKDGVITTKAECEKASQILGLNFSRTVSENNVPAGCYSFSYQAVSAWFNNNTDTSSSNPTNSGAIGLCKREGIIY